MSQRRMQRQILLSYLPRLVNLVVVPAQVMLLTQHLSVESFGIWNMLLSTGFIATLVFSLGLQKVLSVKVPGRSLVIQLSFFKVVLLAESFIYVLFSILFVFLCLPFLAPALNIEEYQSTLSIILFAFFLNLTYSEIGRLLNFQKRIEARIFIVCLEKLLEFGLIYVAVSLVDTTELDVLALLYVALYFILFIFSLIFFKGFSVYFRVRFRWKILKAALLFGSPLLISDVAWKLIQNVDLYMLSAYDLHVDLGIYAFISRLTNYIYLAASPIIWVVYPYLVEAYHKEGGAASDRVKNLLVFQLRYTILFLLAATGGVLININWLVRFLATEEYLSNVAAYVMFFPYPFLVTVLYLGQQILLLDKKIWLISLSYLAGLFANIFGNIFLIPLFGIMGAIASTLLSLIVILCIQGIYFSAARYISEKLIFLLVAQIITLGILLQLTLPWLVENMLWTFQFIILGIAFRIVDLRAVYKWSFFE